MLQERINILYVDDEENNLMSFKATFRIRYHVITSVSGMEALEILEKMPIEIIITDQRMPNMTGIEFLEKVLERHVDPIRILLTGYADMNAVIDAVNKGKIYHYLTKPWNEEELNKTILQAYEAYKEQQRTKSLNEKLLISNDQLEFLARQNLIS